MIGDVIEAIRQYFSWDRVEALFPEGRGIYDLFEIDLSVANTNKICSFKGDQIIIVDCESQAYLRLNDPINDPIDLTVVKQINSPFRDFYITNSAGSGNLKILVGRDGMFRSSSILPVDLLKCNIGNLPIDIKASAIGNLDVDINAQTIGNLDVDLNVQSVNRLIIQDNDGGIESTSNVSQTVNHGTEKIFHSYSGSGSFRYLMVYTAFQTDSQCLAPRLYIDGTLLHPAFCYDEWNTMGANTNTRPFQLTKYAVNGLNCMIIYFEKGLVFDTSLSLRMYNHSGANNVNAHMFWFYQAIT